MPPAHHIVLIGLMASGKTTVGAALAERLGRPFVDNDVVLEARTGRSAREIAAAEGADALHRREAEALVDALNSPVAAVIAAAAAAPLEPDAAAALRPNTVVYLRARPEVLAARLVRAAADDHRPFVADNPSDVVTSQFAERDEPYRKLATLIVDARAESESVVDAISSAL